LDLAPQFERGNPRAIDIGGRMSAAVKGWCPGALRPMPTGDGLLVRVRISAGRLSLDQAEALASCARDCGNGTIEVSSRGNLQLRGVAEAKLNELQARLAAERLIDADPATERVRNMVASSLSDVDPQAFLDVTPIAAALEERFAIDENLRALPGKFGFVIDAGGRWPLGDVEADVRFEAFRGKDGVRFAVWLMGEPHPQPLPVRTGRGVRGAGSSPLPAPCGEGSGVGRAASCAIVLPHNLPDAAARLARAFLTLAGPEPDAPRRMRELVQRRGSGAIFAAAGLAADAVIAPPRTASPCATVGVLALGERAGLGAAPPFGRMRAEAFAELTRAARVERASGLRLTPWRTIVAVGLEAPRAPQLGKQLATLGFIVAPDDPRLGVVVCPGAPACAKAVADVQADAREFAALLPRAGGILLHVSGCAKGCARASPAPLTLVAKPCGYDLVIDGRAGDAPTHRGLSIGRAVALVKSLSGGLAA
jgi:precorrin-3B synthase